ncbi:MAG: glutamate synthase central domain-containing protein [Actinomycetota bacterium]
MPGGVFLDATWAVDEGPAGLRAALEELAGAGVSAAESGSGILLVSDEEAGPERAPIPSLMAVGALNTALLRAGHRTRTSIVVQADDAREAHHFACLLGYGAEAICPRLALATVAVLAAEGRARETGVSQALLHYRSAVEEGVLKILSKMESPAWTPTGGSDLRRAGDRVRRHRAVLRRHHLAHRGAWVP